MLVPFTAPTNFQEPSACLTLPKVVDLASGVSVVEKSAESELILRLFVSNNELFAYLKCHLKRRQYMDHW